MMITDVEVERLEEDQRRTKGTADRRRSEALSVIAQMRKAEACLAEVRSYVEEWEDGSDGDEVLAILDREYVVPPREGPRPDRRKRRIMRVYHRLDAAMERVRNITALVTAWGSDDADGADILRILSKAERPT